MKYPFYSEFRVAVLEATTDKCFKTFVEYPLKLKLQEGLLIDGRFMQWEMKITPITF